MVLMAQAIRSTKTEVFLDKIKTTTEVSLDKLEANYFVIRGIGAVGSAHPWHG